MECPNPECRATLPDHVRHCVVCGADAKVPNVRAAGKEEEVRALQLRVADAQTDALTHGYDAILKDFGDAVSGSVAVICRALGKVSELLSSDSQLFGTFYQGISSDTRLPEDNEWDRIRQAVDSLLFPFYYQELRFAALSIDGSGVTGYGEYCVVLNDVAIKERASIFEENTIVFVKRHRIVAGDRIPVGYKATWENRGLLAVAKLSSRLSPTTAPADYQSILINSGATDSDFIEVNIYGPIHRRAVKRVSGPEPHRKADKVIFRSMLRKLKEIGATWEGRP